MDKRDRSNLFKARIVQAMRDRDLSQSALARFAKVDRSTISQLTTGDAARLPNAQLVAECASALGVSSDWLLGLTDFKLAAADLLAASMEVTEAPRALIDEQIFAWANEAAGYKIRHVPAMMPDMLKTEAMMHWEYAPHLGRSSDQVIGASRDRLEWMQSSLCDYEIALPLFEVSSFANSSGYYETLPAEVRDEQIAHFIELHDRFYPRLRVFLFDARRLWSAPLTVFGPLVGVLYLGQHYLAFRDKERVQMLTAQFDTLVREATVSARDWPDHLTMIASDNVVTHQ